MEWQDISTAPKDGTPILGCMFIPGENYKHLYTPTTVVWAAYHPNSKGKECWRTARICGNKMEGVTHWMPLPTPPNS